jgi:hypothetical protein
VNRCFEPGWEQIGSYDHVGRRGMWVRFHDGAFELCSGREGDDAYVRIDTSNEAFPELERVLSYQAWAQEVSLGECAKTYRPHESLSRYGVVLMGGGSLFRVLTKQLPDGSEAYLDYPGIRVRSMDFVRGMRMWAKLVYAVRAAREWRRRARAVVESGHGRRAH